MLLSEWQNEVLTLSTDEVRRLFVFAWDADATPTAIDHDVLRMLRWIAPVRDVEVYLSGTVTVYRAADGDDLSIRWTSDQGHAASQASNGVLRATVESSDVLAHLTGSGADQILVDPNDLSGVEAVQPAG